MVQGEESRHSSPSPTPQAPAPQPHHALTAYADENASRQDPDMPQIEAYFVRLFSNEVPAAVRARSKDDTYAVLDSAGVDYFLEEIARGSIPVELAFRYELPLIYFMRWLQERADVEDYDFAMGLCADTLAAKSRVALESSPANASDGAMVREYARRALELAERIAPDGWSSGKKPKVDQEAKAPMQIAIIMANGSAPIPGTELLMAKPAQIINT